MVIGRIVACLLVLLGVCSQGLAVTGIANVARQGSATQTSTRVGSGGNAASVAIDGGLGPSFVDDATTTHTLDQPFTTWEVDLGAATDVRGVNLFNRADCCPDRLGDFRVEVLDTPGGSVVASQHFAGNVPALAPEKFTFPAGTIGQAVRVQLVGENGGLNDGLNNAGNGTLSLREVQVLGVTDVANNSNLANLYGAAIQSSTRTGGGGNVARVAIDGNTDGVFNNGSVTHTSAGSPPAFWEVDLGSTFQLQQVNLFNRTDCCGNRLSNFRLSVLDQSRNEVFGQDMAGAVGGMGKFLLPYDTAGQFVRVEFNGLNLAGDNTLSLAEVQTIGGLLPNVARNPLAMASQSSTRVGGGGNDAGFAIDGNTDGVFNNGSVTHTTGANDDPVFWEVDLGDQFRLDEIVLWNRTDCCGNRLSNFRLSVYNGADEVFGTNLFTDTDNTFASFSQELDAVGDRIRIELLGANRNGDFVLSLAEVQAFGQAVPEPTSAILAMLGAAAVVRRRRRA